MNTNEPPAKTAPPVARYAALIGILVVVGIVVTVIVGQRTENPRPTGAMPSPSPAVSTGPTPRY